MSKVPDNESSASAETDEAKKVVSVRFPESQLARLNAFAAVMGTSANDVIRIFCDEGLAAHTATPEFKTRAAAHLQKTLETISTLYDGDVPSGILDGLSTIED